MIIDYLEGLEELRAPCLFLLARPPLLLLELTAKKGARAYRGWLLLASCLWSAKSLRMHVHAPMA